MLPIRTILHPTDFSEQSNSALQLACALARDHGARLVLLHAAETKVTTIASIEGYYLPPNAEEILEESRQRLHRIEVPDGIPVERRVEEGHAITEILRVAKEVNADLIVMGTHGRTGLARILTGSVAEQVLRKASCPVLTVKTPFPAMTSPVDAVEEAAVTV